MVSVQNLGESSYKFVQDPPDSLVCMICLQVVENPQQHDSCGKLFCKKCIDKYKSTDQFGFLSTSCPNCRRLLTTFNDEKSAREVKSLQVWCGNFENGCMWQGELGVHQKHYESCDYRKILCKNQCTSQGKRTEIIQKDLLYHLVNECPKRQHICEFCGVSGEYEERTTTHLDICPMVLIPCPNMGCSRQIARGSLQQHRDNCEYETVSCRFQEIGCKAKMLRREMKAHETDSQKHLGIAVDTVLELKRQNGLSRKTVFKLTQFRERISTRPECYSPPFYSHSRGYKFCVGVNVKGRRENKSYITVYAHLMKGDNDDSLTWPFTGTVTIELLNQLEDKNHHQYTVNYPTHSDDTNQRVVWQNRGRGLGTSKFISHKSLSYNPAKNCEYLKNNSLVFRVSAEESEHKPWLVCTPTTDEPADFL